jgi:uncharacterized membrane protein (UPF0127 family)
MQLQWLRKARLDEPAVRTLVATRRAVHTFGMRYRIDVVFLDERNRVIKIVVAMPPRRMAWCWRARVVVELAAGQARWPAARPARW